MARERALLLDWDGTLLASFRAVERATKAVFEEHGAVWLPARFREHASDWRSHYLAAGVPEHLLPEASHRYLATYGSMQRRLRPGARAALIRLAERGVRIALVTSGRRDRVEPELVHSGLDDLFGAVVCGNDVNRPKPHPESLMLAINTLGVSVQAAVAVGDTFTDELAARAAGIPYIAIRSDYTCGRRRGGATSWRALEVALARRFR